MKNYYLPIHPAPWNAQEKKLLSCLSPERVTKIFNYHFVEDQKLSFYSALLVRMAITIHTQIPNHLLHFSVDSNQKPFLSNRPDCFFNLSHTRNAIFCSLSNTAPVGVDIECIKDIPYEIGNLIFHPAETEFFNAAMSSQEKRECFFKIWTRKEAFTKCFGTGLASDFASINTLSPVTEAFFYTTQKEEYILSLYSSDSISPSLEFISESQLIDFGEKLM